MQIVAQKLSVKYCHAQSENNRLKNWSKNFYNESV